MQPNFPAKTGSKNLKKPNEAIAIRAKNGRLTFLVRKIFNALLHHAQQQHGFDPTRDMYSLPLRMLVTDIEYNSRNIELLRDYCRQMMQTTIEWNDPNNSWEGAVLLAGAKLNFDGSKATIEWGYAPNLRVKLMDPAQYTPLTLHLQNQFKTHAGLALFEICARYETNPSGLTNKAPPEWWFPVLTGNPATEYPAGYKYFKRDTIIPAVAEINAVSHLEIELKEHMQGRKVNAIQFCVTAKAQGSLDLSDPTTPPLIDADLLAKLIGFGFTRTEAEDYYGQLDEGHLRDLVKIVGDRISNKALPIIQSPVALFKSAFRQGYRSTPKTKVQREKAVKTETEDPDTLVRDAARAVARTKFQSLSNNDQKMLLAEFDAEITGNAPLLKMLRKNGLKAKAVEATFMLWLAERAPS